MYSVINVSNGVIIIYIEDLRGIIPKKRGGCGTGSSTFPGPTKTVATTKTVKKAVIK